MKVCGTSTSMNIIDIYNQMKSKELLTRPYYQRRLVWTDKDKEQFIDTILKGFPFPEVYFCQGELDTENIRTVYYVVDGQQRLTTIKDYIEGNLTLKKIPSFAELGDEKSDFLNYNVIVRQLGKISDEKIKEIFDRLNKTDYTLNSTELVYAMYQGEYISIAKKIADENTDFFERIMGEKSISRMADLSFILQIMSTIENGIYFTGDKEVLKFVDMYNEEYERKNSMYKLLKKTFNLYKKLELHFDSLFYKKAASFSLIVELCKINCSISIEKLKQKILEFENCLIQNKDKDLETNPYAKFYNYLYQATASKTARDFRGALLNQSLTK